VLVVAGIDKRYGPVRALRGVGATFAPGEIHAVLGENGAGKSTLMGVLAGFVTPDAGTATLDGSPLPFGRPQAVAALGIAMVHQHFMLVPDFSVAENLALARLERLSGPCDVSALAKPALDLAETLGWSVDPRARTGGLPVGVQQRVEILKALSGNARVLILDEPTAVLGADEVEDLARVLRALRDQGKAVVLIAHKLSEVFAVADRLTVLRRGVKVAESLVADTDPSQVANWMVGEMPVPRPNPPSAIGEEVLRLEGVSARSDRGEIALRDVTLAVREGEVVGIGGVDGNGQVELAETIVGVRAPSSGTLRIASGRIGYVPQDRQQDGLALNMSLQDNMILSGAPDRLFAGPFLRPREIVRWTRDLVERFQIKIGSLADPARSLSGGNQQKIVVSRNLDTPPRILVAVNPTRGLDVQAARFVHESIREATRAGTAVVLVSTDLDELADLADRTYFLSRGELRQGGAEALVGAP
jgi:simple sugar transport system ATP-binding protein